MTEHRSSTRSRTLLQAKVVFNDRSSTFDVVVRNLSGTGAKLELNTPFAVPNRFELEIPARDLHYAAEVRWRDSNHVGVEFVGVVRKAGP